jgi:2-polyprenyl-6-methoxyphenol hydroxylase-like FAD-dependent oxidoreductase
MVITADVCIVGAGPAGALLGYVLARNGISTVLLERHGGLEKEFRGEHLNADAEQILKKYGLFEKIEERGILSMEKVEYFEGNRLIKSVLPARGMSHVGIHFPHSHLLNVLIEESLKYKHYQLMMDTKLTELMQDEHGSYIGVKANKRGKDITISSSVVVGADGRYSTVRKLADIPTKIIRHGYDVLWAKIPSPARWEPTIRMALVNNHQLALFTQAGGFVQIGWNIPQDSFSTLVKQPFEPFIKRLLDAFPELTESVRQHIRSWKDFVYLKVQSSRSETWVKDGLMIIGDAAHTMSPTGAIGVSLAMQDADAAAQVIQAVLAQGDSSAKFLHAFEQVRRKEVEKQQELQFD